MEVQVARKFHLPPILLALKFSGHPGGGLLATHLVQFAEGLLRTRMFFERLVVVLLGLTMSLIVVAMGKPWQEEWSQLNFRSYLFKWKN